MLVPVGIVGNDDGSQEVSTMDISAKTIDATERYPGAVVHRADAAEGKWGSTTSTFAVSWASP